MDLLGNVFHKRIKLVKGGHNSVKH
jgi:hypothetical protein